MTDPLLLLVRVLLINKMKPRLLTAQRVSRRVERSDLLEACAYVDLTQGLYVMQAD